MNMVTLTSTGPLHVILVGKMSISLATNKSYQTVGCWMFSTKGIDAEQMQVSCCYKISPYIDDRPVPAFCLSGIKIFPLQSSRMIKY